MRSGTTSFIKENVAAEKWRENFSMIRRNLLKLSELLQQNVEGKKRLFKKTYSVDAKTFYPLSCVDAKTFVPFPHF